MLLGYPIGEIALLALWIAGAGVLVGILAGLFGIGGGAIIVPVLYEVFRVLDVPEEVRMQTCIGTSLAIIVPTTVRSYFGHKKKGAVIPEVVRICALSRNHRRRNRFCYRVFRTRTGIQDCILIFCDIHRGAHAVRWGALEARKRIAWPRYVGHLRPHHGPIFLTGWSEWGRDIQRGPNAFMDGRCIRRSEHRPGSVCRSRLPVPSATCWPVGGICPFGIFLIPVALRFAASMV